jgi:hypothetical protein
MNVRNVLGVVIGIALMINPVAALIVQQAEGSFSKFNGTQPIPADRRAPPVITGENVYVAWWTNNTSNNNEEIMFRASTDGGATFGDKINLSNTTDADSTRAEIAGEGDNVIVSWWETNQTSDTPVARISTDSGQTFGPMLMLASNGTLGDAEEEEPEGGE